MTQRSAPGGIVRSAASCSGVVTSSFSTRAFAVDQQLLAWRARVGHVIDVPPSKDQLADGFDGHIDLYAAGGMTFTDSRTDAMVLERSVARVSTDSRRDYVFHLFQEGEIGNVTGMQKKRSAANPGQGIIALDLNQPFRMARPACRVLSLFVPCTVIEAALPYAESIHGRIIGLDLPFARLILEYVAATGSALPNVGPDSATDQLRIGAELLIGAFRKESRLNGAGRAALQAALMARVRRYVDSHLHQGDLTPACVVEALQLKRATIYRWFEPEGGLGAYIRNRRLREAADELAKFPDLPVTEIAYGLGFNSASDFTRAFRRAFDMSPQDMRARAAELQRSGAPERSVFGAPGLQRMVR